MTDVFEEPREFGRRVSAARGYVQEQKPAFARRMDVSPSTVRRWEAGDLGTKADNPLSRRQLAESIITRTGCPSELFGIAAGDRTYLDDRVERLQQQVAALAAAVEERAAADPLGSSQDSPQRSALPAQGS